MEMLNIISVGFSVNNYSVTLFLFAALNYIIDRFDGFLEYLNQYFWHEIPHKLISNLYGLISP